MAISLPDDFDKLPEVNRRATLALLKAKEYVLEQRRINAAEAQRKASQKSDTSNTPTAVKLKRSRDEPESNDQNMRPQKKSATSETFRPKYKNESQPLFKEYIASLHPFELPPKRLTLEDRVKMFHLDPMVESVEAELYQVACKACKKTYKVQKGTVLSFMPWKLHRLVCRPGYEEWQAKRRQLENEADSESVAVEAGESSDA